MDEELTVLADVAARLEKAGIPCMLTGLMKSIDKNFDLRSIKPYLKEGDLKQSVVTTKGEKK